MGANVHTAHLRLPWIDSVKQHELSSKCCEYIRKTKPEWSHTGVYQEDTTTVEKFLEWLYSTS